MFSKEDLEQINKKGISLETIEKQLNIFKNGAQPAKLYRNVEPYEDVSEAFASEISIPDESVKFVSFIPASGAATRMFDNLYKTLAAINTVGEDNFILEIDNNPQSTFTFFNNIKKFAFYDKLKECLKRDSLSINELLKENKYRTILEYILGDKGLNYGSKPKALIDFHFDNKTTKYAFEEHIAEAVKYTSCKDVYLHFTLSPEHVDEFYKKLSEVREHYEKKYNVNLHVDTSVQSPATDTIAVNPDNTLFRNPDNSLLFRPAGHGALIHNLDEIDADFILIKNIDNVVPERLRKNIINNRLKMMNCFLQLCLLRNQLMFELENAIENKRDIDLSMFETACELTFKIFLQDSYKSLKHAEKLLVLHKMLNRPMRMCAMVRNEGEPGGGPFVVYDNEKLSMQIVEKSQVDSSNPHQMKIFESAKYFNPVDLVCCVVNYKRVKYNLLDFIDEKAVFISNKTKDGKPLKALELPGLWNGAMSDWITIFVEVPASTFNPVKTVNDLLRPAHQ